MVRPLQRDDTYDRQDGPGQRAKLGRAVEPAANHGNVAVVVEQTDQTTVTEVRSINFSAPTPLRASRSYHRERAFQGDGMGPPPGAAVTLCSTGTPRPSYFSVAP